MSLAGKTALVTGGGRGIGRAIALGLARAGARIVVTGRTTSELTAVADETGGLARTLDLADRGAITGFATSLLAEVGRVDVLINNAGIAESASIAETTDELYDRTMAVNVTAPFALTRALLPPMLAAGWGRIVAVASNAGLTGYAYSTAYCASKHAIVGLTRALAMEIATSGVTVNAVCPGWVDTKMTDVSIARIAERTGRSPEDAKRALTNMSPQRRLIAPDEIAHAVLSLMPHEARGIHGQAIAIDGGQTGLRDRRAPERRP